MCCAVLCCAVLCSAVLWCGGCGVVWCGEVWCGVVWYGVVWCGVDMSPPRKHKKRCEYNPTRPPMSHVSLVLYVCVYVMYVHVTYTHTYTHILQRMCEAPCDVNSSPSRKPALNECKTLYKRLTFAVGLIATLYNMLFAPFLDGRSLPHTTGPS